jgi:hypothetical protein
MGIGAAPRLSSRLNLGWMWKPALRSHLTAQVSYSLEGMSGIFMAD